MRDNNLLSSTRLETFHSIAEWWDHTGEPCSQEDIHNLNPDKAYSSVRGRFNELVKMGLIEEVGTKVSATNRNLISYAPTGMKIPKPLKKNKCGWVLIQDETPSDPGFYLLINDSGESEIKVITKNGLEDLDGQKCLLFGLQHFKQWMKIPNPEKIAC